MCAMSQYNYYNNEQSGMYHHPHNHPNHHPHHNPHHHNHNHYNGMPGGMPQPAGFWIRFWAYLIDTVCLVILSFIAGFAWGVLSAVLGMSETDTFIGGYLIGGVVAFLYFTILHASPMQGTIGKKALGLYVVDANGNRISFGRSFLRYLSTILSSILYIGYIMIGVTRDKRGLHDMIASTYVFKK